MTNVKILKQQALAACVFCCPQMLQPSPLARNQGKGLRQYKLFTTSLL
jgi:hypothetical protein